jgi:hypothetical protein
MDPLKKKEKEKKKMKKKKNKLKKIQSSCDQAPDEEQKEKILIKKRKRKRKKCDQVSISVEEQQEMFVFPHNFNETHPVIQFRKMSCNTSASSSLASCFNVIGLTNTAAWIDEWGRTDARLNGNPSKILRLIQDLLKSGLREFSKKYEVKKINSTAFDIWDPDEEKKKSVKLLQFTGQNNLAGHSITIYDGLIFDSNFQYSVELNKKNLEFCIQSSYKGILHGYEFIQRTNANIIIPDQIRSEKPCSSIDDNMIIDTSDQNTQAQKKNQRDEYLNIFDANSSENHNSFKSKKKKKKKQKKKGSNNDQENPQDCLMEDNFV